MRWLHFILSHSVFIAICAAALAFQTALLSGVKCSIYLCGFIFFATLCSYNSYWLLSKYIFRSHSSVFIFFRRNVVNLILLVLSAAGLSFSFLQLQLSMVVILPAIILVIVYAIPLLPLRFFRFTKKLGVLKTVVLAFTWSYVTVLIPFNKGFWLLSNNEWFLFTRRFLFMLMLCIIFDSRDISIDKMRGFRSLATDLKPLVLQYLVLTIFMSLFITNFLCTAYGIHINQAIGLQISTVILLITYFLSTQKQGYFFYYFWVDGQMLFSALITYVVTVL